MSEKEKTAKEIGKKAAKQRDTEMGFAAQFPSAQNDATAPTSFQKKYGADYFTGTEAHKHAQDLEIKAKALQDIRKIYKETKGEHAEPVATVSVTDKDVEAYKAFLDLEYLRDFDLYTGEQFLKDASPAQVKWINDIYPDIFTRRIEEIDKILNVQKKKALINVLGPRSKEDLMFLYEIDLMRSKKDGDEKYKAIFETSVALQVGQGDKAAKTRGYLSAKAMYENFPSIERRAEPTNRSYLNARPPTYKY